MPTVSGHRTENQQDSRLDANDDSTWQPWAYVRDKGTGDLRAVCLGGDMSFRDATSLAEEVMNGNEAIDEISIRLARCAPRGNVEARPAPVVPVAPNFPMLATEEIQTPRRTIYPGEYVIIDPEATPAEGKMVLVGGRIDLWVGQPDISGVVVSIWSDDTSLRN